MYRNVRLILILIALSVWCEAAVIQVHNESDRKLYCEVFQSTNFDGESVQIPASFKIINFTQLTQSWIDSGDGSKFYSFKLPSSIPSGISCAVRLCTKENFDGNCTVFKLSQERIEPCKLKSFECNCFNDAEKSIESIKATEISVVDQQSADRKEVCGHNEDSKFQNFTKLGKTIIGVGRNYV